MYMWSLYLICQARDCLEKLISIYTFTYSSNCRYDHVVVLEQSHQPKSLLFSTLKNSSYITLGIVTFVNSVRADEHNVS